MVGIPFDHETVKGTEILLAESIHCIYHYRSSRSVVCMGLTEQEERNSHWLFSNQLDTSIPVGSLKKGEYIHHMQWWVTRAAASAKA